MVSVRPARDSERPGLLSVWRSAVDATHDFLSPADIDWYEPHVLAHLRSAKDVRIATPTESTANDAGGADAAVGFIAQEGGAIQMLFVSEDAQGTGVGSALLADVVADVSRSGIDELSVDVNEDNESGRRFYAARGFVVASRSDHDDQGRPFPILHLRLRLHEGQA